MPQGAGGSPASISGGFADAPELTCPFCGAPETDRIDLDGDRFLVFQCMFTPQVDPSLPDAALSDHLRRTYEGRGERYFRSMCDRMHLFVSAGEGARTLQSDGPIRRVAGPRPS